MYNISPNSQLYGKAGLLQASQSVMEATNKQWIDLLTMLHRSGKTKIADVAYVFEMSERDLKRIFSRMEREGLVVMTSSMVDITSKGRDWVRQENPMVEAALRDRDYEVKNGKVYISKKKYSKVHKDYKGKDNGKPMMMAMGPKGTTLYPVEFTEETELDEAKRYSKHDQQVIQKHIEFLKAIATPGNFNQAPYELRHKTKDEVINQLKGMGLTDLQISKLKIGRMKPSELMKESTEPELNEAIDRQTMQNYYERLFYAIMTNSERGRNSATLQDIQNDLQNNRNLKIPTNHIPAVLAKAEREGYIKQDGAAYQLTQKAMKMVRAREESFHTDEVKSINEEVPSSTHVEIEPSGDGEYTISVDSYGMAYYLDIEERDVNEFLKDVKRLDRAAVTDANTAFRRNKRTEFVIAAKPPDVVKHFQMISARAKRWGD